MGDKTILLQLLSVIILAIVGIILIIYLGWLAGSLLGMSVWVSVGWITKVFTGKILGFNGFEEYAVYGGLFGVFVSGLVLIFISIGEEEDADE